jgi:hypothetical protein
MIALRALVSFWQYKSIHSCAWILFWVTLVRTVRCPARCDGTIHWEDCGADRDLNPLPEYEVKKILPYMRHEVSWVMVFTRFRVLP